MPSDLIYDILFSIFERVHYTVDYDLDRESLLHFSLVRRAWTLPAQHILFRNVIIKYRDNLRSFDSATKATKGKAAILRNSVQMLHVWLANGPMGRCEPILPICLS